MKKLAYVSGILAALMLVLGFIARFFFFDKALIGIHALTFLHMTNTMLLLAIALLLFDHLSKK